MRLQSDIARIGIDTQRIAPGGVGGAALEPGCFLAIEADDIVLIIDLDLVTVPLPGREIAVVLIILLAWPGAQRFDLVNRAGSGKERTVWLAETGVAARFLVDL